MSPARLCPTTLAGFSGWSGIRPPAYSSPGSPWKRLLVFMGRSFDCQAPARVLTKSCRPTSVRTRSGRRRLSIKSQGGLNGVKPTMGCPLHVIEEFDFVALGIGPGHGVAGRDDKATLGKRRRSAGFGVRRPEQPTAGAATRVPALVECARRPAAETRGKRRNRRFRRLGSECRAARLRA
jgi:hypothetical protein